MRKSLFLGLLVLCLVIPETAGAELWEPDIRKVRWGMTREEVTRSEGKPPASSGKESLGYADTLFGSPAAVEYLFTGETLTALRYTVHFTQKDGAQSFFVKVSEVLREKYGTDINAASEYSLKGLLFKYGLGTYGDSGHIKKYLREFGNRRTHVLLVYEPPAKPGTVILLYREAGGYIKGIENRRNRLEEKEREEKAKF